VLFGACLNALYLPKKEHRELSQKLNLLHIGDKKKPLRRQLGKFTKDIQKIEKEEKFGVLTE